MKALSLSVLLLFSGCILDEKAIYCPKTVAFDFSLPGGESSQGKITSVNVGIFDGRGGYLRTERVEETGTARLEEIKLNLGPGDYRLVFWANMNGCTRIDDRGTGDAWRVVHSDALFDTDKCHITGQTDPLWFAPFESDSRQAGEPLGYLPLKVSDGEAQREAVVFTHAHRTLEIYVEGIEGLPAIEIEGLPSGLHYSGLEQLASNVTYRRPTVRVEREGRAYAAASFRTFRFDDTAGIDIVIRDADSDEMFRTSLADAVTRSGGNPDGIEIVLVFRFMKGSVEIDIPKWSRDKIDVD